MGSARASVMKFLVLLSVVSLASAAPLPEGEEAAVAVEAEAPVAVEEDAPAALPYVHDATGDVAEAYVHEEVPAEEAEIAPETYVHEEIAAEVYEHDATGDVAEAYTHEDIAPEVYTHEEPVVAAVAPVTYSVSPTAGVIPITAYAGVYAGHPLTYSYAAYPYAVYHTPTGCVNNVGSVVPCA